MSAAEARHWRVVMVEDNPDHALFIRRALTGYAIDLAHFTDGDQAFQHFFGAHPAPCPDLVLLDVNLPKRNGFEILERLKSHEQFKTVPVIMLSTTTQPSEIERAYRMGANAFVNKPVDFQAFTSRIQQIRSFWLDVSILPERAA